MSYKIVKSRFAALPDDDEANASQSLTKAEKQKQKELEKKAQKEKEAAEAKKAKKKRNKENKKNKQKEEKAQKDSLGVPGQPDADWVTRDKQWADKQFEHDVNISIMLSRQEMEKEAASRAQQREEPAGSSAKKSKNKKVIQQIGLGQHNLSQSDHSRNQPDPATPTSDFFASLDRDIQAIVHKDHQQERLRESIRNVGPTSVQDPVNTAPCSAACDPKTVELSRQSEVEDLRKTLEDSRNVAITLHKTLDERNNREKSTLMAQISELTQERDELTETVARLNVELEQERSKNRDLIKENRKLQGRNKNS